MRRTGMLESLRNTRRSMGDGTLGGRSRIATPYRPERLRTASTSVSGGQTTVTYGEYVAFGSDAVTIAGAGASVLSTAEFVLTRSGFSSVQIPGDVPKLPYAASYTLEVYVRWTDGYRGGGSVSVTLDGSEIPALWDDTEHWNDWGDSITFVGDKNQNLDIEVTPRDGLDHLADVTVRLAVVEPLVQLAATLPMQVVLAIDVSTSMNGNDPNYLGVEGAQRFLARMRSEDAAAAMTWGADSDIELRQSMVELTTGAARQQVYNGLEFGRTRDGSGTHPGSAVSVASANYFIATQPIKVILLLTDGEANGGDSLAVATANANAADVTVYTIGLGGGVNTSYLTTMAEDTGGRYNFADTADDLSAVFDQISTDLLVGVG